MIAVVGIFTLAILCRTTYASGDSIKSECSKFDFQEKVLEKLIRIEHKMEIQELSINKWKNNLEAGLATIDTLKQGMYLS